MCEGNKNAVLTATSKDNDQTNRNANAGPIKSNDTEKNIENDSIGSQIPSGCSLCHIPYSKIALPVNGKMRKCAVCK